MTVYNCQGARCDTNAALLVLSGGDESITELECVIAMKRFDEEYGDTDEMQNSFCGVPCGAAILALEKALETKNA